MLILVTGGSRSGKSAYALQRARAFPEPRHFIATAQASDDEMTARIEAHKKSRGQGWALTEEPLAVAAALSAALTDAPGRAPRRAGVVVIDCITLWVSNLILADEAIDEKKVADRAEELAAIAREASSAVIVVTNEVGSGVVPDNALARRFRDCAGRANQVLAASAQEAWLMVSGLPLALRPGQETT